MDPLASEHQFSIQSEVFQESNEPAFDLHGMYPGRDCVASASDKLNYD